MQFLRYFLFPFSVIYGIITAIRNKLYDWNVFSSYEIPIKSIVVGNLSVGGTGKTPHINYLINLFCDSHQVVVLSRGYGRKSKGFILANDKSTSSDIGDEPLLIYRQFGAKIKVAVCEKRKVGVETILAEFPETNLILLDDAFQHRAIKAGFNILLTTFSKPFSKDFMLPTGNLREFRCFKNRADAIIISKVVEQNSTNEIELLKQSLKFEKPIFTSKIKYQSPISFHNNLQINSATKNVLLVTGIANSNSLVTHLKKQFEVQEINFGDHHQFSLGEINEIHQKFDNLALENAIILTTEKDYMRFDNQLLKITEPYPWFYLPIVVEIENKEKFNQLIKNYVGTI